MGSHETALNDRDRRPRRDRRGGGARTWSYESCCARSRRATSRIATGLYAREPWEEEHLDARFRLAIGPARRRDLASVGCPPDRPRVRRLPGYHSYLTAILTRVPTATMVYDLAALDPATRPALRSAVVERMALRASVGRSDALLAISQATADALAETASSVCGEDNHHAARRVAGAGDSAVRGRGGAPL